MKVDFFPTDRAPFPKHGTFFAYPGKYNSLAEAFAAGCPVLGYLHGKGVMDQGTGTDKELHELFNMGMFKNGFWEVNKQPGAVDVENMIICMVQTNTGYEAGEIEFLLEKIAGYKPTTEPTLQGFSWGGWGILGNVGSGKVDPRALSSIWLLAPGISDARITAFLAKMKGVDTPVYIVYNVNDTLVKYEPGRLMDKLYNGLKAQGNRVAYVKFKNVWTSSDGSKTSHGVVAWVFPSRWWRMFNTDKAAINSANYAEIFSNDTILTYNFYEMMRKNLDEVVLPGEPIPDPDAPGEEGVKVGTWEVWQRPDGKLYTKEIS
jgi:hypothetical protein